MNRKEHLLAVLAEECTEISKNVMKALRFGLLSRELGQTKTNAERIHEEIIDLYAVVEMVEAEEIVTARSFNDADAAMRRKKEKVEKYLLLAHDLGACGDADKRVAILEAAIKAHRSQKADDRCIEDDDRLYAALGDGIPCDRSVGSKDEMLKNCERFIDRRTEGGTWPTYAELEARLADAEERLREKP